ncbi:MAG: hypothetical protein NTW87_04970 [Planctomycetota bacterium]|nr:hypothetical protein [Planctomycetota bacterium]
MTTMAVANPAFYSARERLRSFATRALARLRLQEAIHSLLVVLAISFCLLVVLLFADRYCSLMQAGINVWIIWGGLTALGVPYILWRAYSPRIHENLAAILADDRLGLHARLCTALTIDLSDPATADFSEAFLAEALHRIQKLDVERAFPIRVPRAFALLLFPLAASAAIYFLMQPQDRLGLVAARENKRKAEAVRQKAAATLAGKLERLKEKIDEQGIEKGGEYKVKQLIQQADAIAKDLREGKRNPDEALIALGQLKREIQEEKEKLAQGKEFLDRLAKLSAKDLNLEQSDLTREVSEALQNGDPGKAAQQLRKLAQQLKKDILDDPNKTDEQRKQQLDQLQREVEKLAGALAEDEALRDNLRELSKDVMSAAEFQALEQEIKKAMEKQGKGNKKLGDDIEKQMEEVAEELERLQEDNDADLTDAEEQEKEDLDTVEDGIDEAMDGLANGEPGGT